MAQVKLVNSDKVAIVDDADYAEVSRYNWRLSSTGYPSRTYRRLERAQQGTVQMGRHILGMPYGDKREADHVNRDTLDNRRSNLRITSRAGNAQNRRHAGGSSKYRGVTWHKGCQRWQAAAKVAGKNHYLGLFDDEMEAARSASEFRAEHMSFAVEPSSAA
jgi:hypothetical protein